MSASQTLSKIFAYCAKLLQDKNPYVVISGLLLGYISTRYAFISMYRRAKKHPAGPVGVPFLGSALMFLQKPYATLNAIGSYGKITTVQLGFNTNIFINDIRLAKNIMANKAIGLHRPYIANPPRFIHFLAINGNSWQRRRKYFTSEFVPKVSDSKYVYKVINDTINNDVVQSMNDCINTKQLWYPNKYCSFIDLNLMMNAIFGVNLLLNDDQTGYVKQLLPVPQAWFVSITRVLILAACVKFNVGSYIYSWFTNDHNNLEKTAGELLMKFMEEHGGFEFDVAKNRLKRKINNGSYIDFLINETDMTLDEIMSDIALALIAGTNTTSKALEYAFVLLSQNAVIQEEIYQELSQIDDHIKDITKANKLRAFIQEVLRLSVVSPLGMPHVATKNVNIDGSMIPKGAIVHNNMYYIHRKGSNDNTVHLEYWLDEAGKFKMDNNRFMLFSYGGRGCPGRPIAMKLMYYVLSSLIMKYKFSSVNDDKDIKQRFATVPIIEPEIGIQLQTRE